MQHSVQWAETLGRTRTMYIGIRTRALWPRWTQHLWQQGSEWWKWWMLWDCGFLLGSEVHCAAESEASTVCGLGGGTSSRGPQCEIKTYWPHTQAELVNFVSSLGKQMENCWQLGFCDFGTKGWTRCLWRFCKSLRREVEGQHVRCYFGSVKIQKGAWAGKGPIQVTQTQMWGDLWGVLWCRSSRTVYCKACPMMETVYCKGCVLRFRKV